MWGITGAALATLVAYAVVMSIELTFEKTWHYIFTKDKLKYMISGVAVVIVFYVVKTFFSFHPAITLSIGIIVAGLLYVTILYFMKESTIEQVICRLKLIIRKK